MPKAAPPKIKKPVWTADQIQKFSGPTRIDMSHYVKILSMKSKKVSPPAVHYTCKTRTPRVDSSAYVTEVLVPSGSTRPLVSCSCQDFMFRWEVALARAGNSTIHYSNGAPPSTNNPPNIPGACKHVLRVFDKLREIGAL